MKNSILILALFLLTACKVETGPKMGPDTISHKLYPAPLSEELLQADRDFAALSESADPKTAFGAYLAANAIMMGRSGDPVEGYEAAMASFGDEAGFDLHWQPQFAEVASAGDMGWTWGRYQFVVDGETLYRGKYVNIWTRQADGSWKVRLDMGNQEPE
jgi:ketosteroid isomerase-like protein